MSMSAVSTEPSPIKVALYVQPEASFYGGFFHFLSHTSPSCNPLDRLRNSGVLDDSTSLAAKEVVAQRKAMEDSPEEQEPFITLEAGELFPELCTPEALAIAEPSLRVAAAASAGAATAVLQLVDGALTLISIGILALLGGNRYAAGLLLSRSAVYAFTCTAAAFATEGVRALIVRLLRKAEALEVESESFGAPKWKAMHEGMLEGDSLKLHGCQSHEMQQSNDWQAQMQTKQGEASETQQRLDQSSRWYTSPFTFKPTRSAERAEAGELQGRHGAMDRLLRGRAPQYSGTAQTDLVADTRNFDEGKGSALQS